MGDHRAKVASLFSASVTPPPELAIGHFEGGDRYLIDGEIRRWKGPMTPVESPVCTRRADGSFERVRIGEYASLGAPEAMAAVGAAVKAYDHGRGEWPRARVARRLEALGRFAEGMLRQRDLVVKLLMWEVGKTLDDSRKEFDRTHEYVVDTIAQLQSAEQKNSTFVTDKGVIAQLRRAPLGVVLCMGPYNYPLNEGYATMIPALAMGNTVISKLPRIGMLSNLPLLELLRDCFPRGVVNVLNGDGRTLVGPIMDSGKIDVLAFIGNSRTADTIQRTHPSPRRLRGVLGLDAKNPAIVLPDADLDHTIREVVKGSLSFNGQRCTALKLILVHEDLAARFVERLVPEVEKLAFGMPWEKVTITPLPDPGKPAQLTALVADAVARGARVVNPTGGATCGTFFFPAVVYPVTPAMELYHKEQFGPILPISVWRTRDELERHLVESPFGQQASVFGRDPAVIGPLVDLLANQVCRVNLNAKCQRGPDSFPFTGRKDSAEGTLSVADALDCFSIPSLVAANDDGPGQVLRRIVEQRTSQFLRSD